MKQRTKKFITVTAGIIASYFVICIALFFFEPADYSAPDLTDYQYYFDLYEKYDISNNNKFYIKQISADDVVAFENDKRLKYVSNTVLTVANEQYNYNEVTSLLNDYNAEICGYISDVNFYQLEFIGDYSYNELMEQCQNLMNSGIFSSAVPDYFEETPVSEYSTEETEYISELYYSMLNLDEAWKLYGNTESANIGVIDFLIGRNEYLNIVNSDEFSDSVLDDITYASSVDHGTHVAGIIGASHSSDVRGVIDNANIYSYCGINLSTSYWIANLCDMIINNNVKAVNISMAYNSYINISASLGCENAIEHIENEQKLFSDLLSNMIENGNEFVICTAAGNDGYASVYRTFGSYFSYGDKKILNKIDILGIFDTEPDYVDAKYSFMMSNAPDDAVRDRIITVGSVDSYYNYSLFSNCGSVDIAAPGEKIYSTVPNNEYVRYSGTSMATPFVTGTAAMIFSLDPDLTGAEVKNIIISSATNTVTTGEFTYPVLNIGEAVKNTIG